MSFRTRLFLAILVAVLLPLSSLAYGVRREMERRLTAEYEQRVSSLASVIEADLSRESATVGERLKALVSDIDRDNRFRLAAVRGDAGSRQYLLDYAGTAMRLSGLSMLQVQDSLGRVISSGHFRNQFDQLQPELPRLLASRSDTLVLVRTRTPEAPLLALARSDSFRLGGKRFTLTGGVAFQRWARHGLGHGADVAISLVVPRTADTSSVDRRVVREVRLPYVDLLGQSGALDTARLVVTQSLGTLESLRHSVNRWSLAALALSLGIAVAAAAWLSSRISQPLRELADKTSRIDLDRLDQSFASDRPDEIGALSRLLGAMTDRLRASTSRLREAERRAAVGDLARQVNHDIKNGLSPLRNVLRHLTQVLQQDPASLPTVFEARQGTLDSSIEYLDTLARHYDRLSPTSQRQPCDVNLIVGDVLRTTPRDGAAVQSQLAQQLPSVLGDSLMVRRIVENLVGNALDSIGGKPGGTVTISTERLVTADQPDWIRISISDTGPGMTRSQLDRAFDDFYTTKPGGTGLGLSIVRRLILDLNGRLRVETEPGAGTRIMVELPSAPPGDAAA